MFGLEFGFSPPQNKIAWVSSSGFPMAIYRLIASGSFGPNEMTAAYEAALVDLAPIDRDDPLTKILARAIGGIASMGEHDPATIKHRALNILRMREMGANGERRPDPGSSTHEYPQA
jgi:hypothetical protein